MSKTNNDGFFNDNNPFNKEEKPTIIDGSLVAMHYKTMVKEETKELSEEEQTEKLREQAMSTGEIVKLNQEKLPGCYLHRTAVNDVARVEHRTFICTSTKEMAGPTNNWCDPKEMYEKGEARLREIAATLNKTAKLLLFTQGGEEDIAYANGKEMLKVFDKCGIKYEYSEMPGGHSWHVWRHDLHNLAPRLFK